MRAPDKRSGPHRQEGAARESVALQATTSPTRLPRGGDKTKRVKCASCSEFHPVIPGEHNCDLVQRGLPYVLLPRTERDELAQRLQVELAEAHRQEETTAAIEFATLARAVQALSLTPTFQELRRRRGDAA